MKKKILSLVICGIMLMPFNVSAAVKKVTYNKPELTKVELAEYIKNTSESLTDEQAGVIFGEIKEQILLKYEGVYEFSKFSVEIVNEEIENDKISIDVNVDANMTLIRHPQNSPYVEGMNLALNKLSNNEEKQIAQNEIDEYLKEVGAYYNEPSPTTFLYRIELENNYETQIDTKGTMNNDVQYNLFYRADITTEETILTAVKTSEKIDESLAKENGEKSIIDGVSENSYLNETLKSSVTYDRIAARDYALNQAFAVPEFSQQNGMGSDCANFVSKAINAGGIPVDENGSWYPSPQSGSYAGVNWMRT